MCACVHVCVRACVRACVRVCACVYEYIYEYIYIHTYTCVCVCVCVCVCTYIYITVCWAVSPLANGMYHDPLISGEFHVADMMPVAIDTIMMRMKRNATTRKLVTRWQNKRKKGKKNLKIQCPGIFLYQASKKVLLRVCGPQRCN
jgi:hypothetical protein